jgi:hypothetical protein
MIMNGEIKKDRKKTVIVCSEHRAGGNIRKSLLASHLTQYSVDGTNGRLDIHFHATTSWVSVVLNLSRIQWPRGTRQS